MPDSTKCYEEKAAKENRELEGKAGRLLWQRWCCLFNSMSKEGLSDKMTLEQRIVGAAGGNHVDIWENQSFRGHSVQRP